MVVEDWDEKKVSRKYYIRSQASLEADCCCVISLEKILIIHPSPAKNGVNEMVNSSYQYIVLSKKQKMFYVDP